MKSSVKKHIILCLQQVSPAIVVVALYAIGFVATAWARLDTSWDSLAYHLPFAGIRAGVVSYADYIIPANHRPLLEGFPPLIDVIKGMLWRITGRAEATQLFNIIVVGMGAVGMSRLYGMRFAVIMLAVIAIPIGQIEFASNYTDLAVNFLLAVAMFSAVHALATPREHKSIHTISTALVLCIATFFKVTAIPFGIILWLLYALCAGSVWRSDGMTWLARLRQKSLATYLSVVMLGSTAALGYGIINLFVMGNPLFPVPIELGPISLPGTVPSSNWVAASYLQEAPRSIRWLISVLEWHAFDYRPLPYIVSQGDVPETAKSYRMGGLFAYQLLLTIAIVCVLWEKLPKGVIIKVALLHAVIALIVSLVPGSHEMRYFFFWYLSFLWSAYLIIDRKLADRTFVKIFVASLTVSALYITLITGGRYVYPFKDMPSAEELVQGSIRAEVWAHLKAGQSHFCVADKEPMSFLYSRPFHDELAEWGGYQVSADLASSTCSTLQPNQ